MNVDYYPIICGIAIVLFIIMIWLWLMLEYYKDKADMYEKLVIEKLWQELEADRKRHAMNDEEWDLEDLYNLLHALKQNNFRRIENGK